jgi:DNA-binding MarR family transcriptional regulator
LLDQFDEVRAKIERVFDTAVDATVPSEMLPTRIALDRVRKIIRLRARRQRIFGSDIFGEPAWDMLLDLYSAALERRAESVTSLALASGVPPTTALRCMQLLEEDGWIARKPDPNDGRRILMSLSSRGRSAMEQFISQPDLESF